MAFEKAAAPPMPYFRSIELLTETIFFSAVIGGLPYLRESMLELRLSFPGLIITKS